MPWKAPLPGLVDGERRRRQLGRLAAGERDPAEERHPGHDIRLPGEHEVVAGAQVDVADAAAETATVAWILPLRLDEGHEQRDLPAPQDAHGPEEILLEVPLGDTGTGAQEAPARVVRPEHGPRLELHPDKRILVELEAPRRDGAPPRAARLRPRARGRSPTRRVRREARGPYWISSCGAALSDIGPEIVVRSAQSPCM